ncbi:aldehyde dehydrogenase family protein [Vibrio astriarenae]|uniref:Aldehyde dehydrogenase n=1 Tax=Vibrio astriarenae TaxID=1481923 RepID=A0A7Z2T2Q8_9VIBR|nr:coniferyl aldehyde dehydrogenase [Vibrio astriarenae]QIA63207.1 aldehyde dehydrogenase family protein [Vibrio astriarenae]
MNAITEINQAETLNQSLDLLRECYNQQLCLPIEARINNLKLIKQSLIEHRTQLIEALSNDFGCRTEFDTSIADIMPTVAQINYTLKHLKQWMKPSKRSAGLMFMPSKVAVEYQPLGVVGIIAPWNFPVILSVGPIVTALAAGNRVMLKLSEFTPKTNQVITKILSVLPEHILVIEGAAEVAAEFSALPFDHLLFTGSTQVGRYVAQAAAPNLTPITLELGGKSPVIVAKDSDLDVAVDAVLFGKCLNAGQICVAPDYAFVPKEKVDAFITRFFERLAVLYPEIEEEGGFTQIINERQYDRLMAALEEAKQQGAIVHTKQVTNGADSRLITPHLMTDVTDDMTIMRDEIFGPLLPIKPYQDIQEALDYINSKDRPLALYIMSTDKLLIQRIVNSTHSGGVGINETVFHVGAEDAPFGGVGPSGMGHYHGVEGFRTFSHAKTVFHTPAWLGRIKLLLKSQQKMIKMMGRLFIR